MPITTKSVDQFLEIGTEAYVPVEPENCSICQNPLITVSTSEHDAVVEELTINGITQTFTTFPHAGTKLLGCGHAFGTECLREWLQASRTCPYCRRATSDFTFGLYWCASRYATLTKGLQDIQAEWPDTVDKNELAYRSGVRYIAINAEADWAQIVSFIEEFVSKSETAPAIDECFHAHVHYAEKTHRWYLWRLENRLRKLNNAESDRLVATLDSEEWPEYDE
jgi:uncharacterized protein with PIN domain